MSLRLGPEHLEGGGDVDCTGMSLGETDLGEKLSCPT